MATVTCVCGDEVTADIVVNKCVLYASSVAVSIWTVPSVLEEVEVGVEVLSPPAGLCVCWWTAWPGSSVRSGDAELPAGVGRAGGKALLWPMESTTHHKKLNYLFVFIFGVVSTCNLMGFGWRGAVLVSVFILCVSYVIYIKLSPKTFP